MATSRYRILVVDDEEPIRKGLARVIAGLGHEVEVAESAEEALERAMSFTPDLVITDLHLPGRSGLELVADLQRPRHRVDAGRADGPRLDRQRGRGDPSRRLRLPGQADRFRNVSPR